MTKKGIVLTILLICILILIGVMIYKQNINSNINKPENLVVNEENSQEVEQKPINIPAEFELEITNETGFDLNKLISYEIPVIIQVGSSENELCAEMLASLQTLNKEVKQKAIVKYIDTLKYLNLWTEDRITLKDEPIQLLFNKDGTPFKTNLSEALGYKSIKDENGNHIYTVHEGDLTLNDMYELLREMGME